MKNLEENVRNINGMIDYESQGLGEKSFEERLKVDTAKLINASHDVATTNSGGMEELIEVFKKIGYTEEHIEKIINSWVVRNLKTETIIKNVNRNYMFFRNLGYTNEDIINMSGQCETIYNYSIENMKMKIEQFQDMGYTRQEALNIFKVSSRLFGFSINYLQEKIVQMQKLGYSKEDVIKMGKRYPILFELRIQKIQERHAQLQELGYSKQQVLKIIKLNPRIFRLSIEVIRERIEEMQSLGYTKDDVLYIVQRQSSILWTTFEVMQEKIEQMQKMGYTKEEVLKMARSNTRIYNLSIEHVQSKIEKMKQLGYRKEEILNMCKMLPVIFSLSTDNIQEKVEFYYFIGLSSLVTQKPTIMIQSVQLSYAKYKFLEGIGVYIDETNYYSLLMEQNSFEKKYGITNEELLAKYDYQDFLNQRNADESLSIQNTLRWEKQKMRRLGKEEFVRKVIAFKKKQEKKIAQLEAQKKKEGVDIGE